MDDFKKHINNSIQFRLSFGLFIIIGIVAALAMLVSYRTALTESKEIQDGTLKQIALMVEHDQIQPLSVSHPNKKSLIIIQELGAGASQVNAEHAYLRLPAHLKDGFHTLELQSHRYRVLVHRLPDARQIAIAQPTALRDDAVRSGVLATVSPLVILLILLLISTYFLIRKAFAPVIAVSKSVALREAHDFSPFPVDTLPNEIRPFVMAINQQLERGVSLLAAQKRFIADAAHELRTPMTALLLQSERLAHADMSELAKERLSTLRQGISRSKKLLEQLLSYARAQTPFTTPAMVSLQKIFAYVLENVMPMAEEKNIKVEVLLNEDIAVRANEAQLICLLTNILDNAIRYIPTNGRVYLSAMVMDSQIVLEVEDDGPGIAEEEVPRVFEAFYRGNAQDAQGSGLGLAIVSAICNQIGAAISLKPADRFKTGLKVKVSIGGVIEYDHQQHTRESIPYARRN